jgi:hypothetical protein
VIDCASRLSTKTFGGQPGRTVCCVRSRRLMAQVHRIMEINQLGTVTSEVVVAARESLVIGVM